MLSTRWEPFTDLWRGLDLLQRRMDQLLDDSHREGWPGFAGAFPLVNLWEDDVNVYAECELPGMELDALEIQVTGGSLLTIKGGRGQPEQPGGVWHRQERGFGAFTRVLELPVDVDPDRVEARLAHGVLTVTLPKAEAARPRRISVRAE